MGVGHAHGLVSVSLSARLHCLCLSVQVVLSRITHAHIHVCIVSHSIASRTDRRVCSYHHGVLPIEPTTGTRSVRAATADARRVLAGRLSSLARRGTRRPTGLTGRRSGARRGLVPTRGVEWESGSSGLLPRRRRWRADVAPSHDNLRVRTDARSRRSTRRGSPALALRAAVTDTPTAVAKDATGIAHGIAPGSQFGLDVFG